jgi:hypothetical protein
VQKTPSVANVSFKKNLKHSVSNRGFSLHSNVVNPKLSLQFNINNDETDMNAKNNTIELFPLSIVFFFCLLFSFLISSISVSTSTAKYFRRHNVYYIRLDLFRNFNNFCMRPLNNRCPALGSNLTFDFHSFSTRNSFKVQAISGRDSF